MFHKKDKYILIGNSFPLSFVRRDVKIKVSRLDILRKELYEANVLSFWGAF